MRMIRFNEPYDYQRFEECLIDTKFDKDDLTAMDWQDLKKEFMAWLENPDKVKKIKFGK